MMQDTEGRAEDVQDAVVVDADEVLEPDLTRRTPVIDRLQPAQRELLFRKHAMGRFRPEGADPSDPSAIFWRGPNGLDETDIASMLEVAALLGLDPFTPGEIWCARSKPKRDGEDPGKLLVMVGRDGRRKIVQRNGLRMRGDVIRENDVFEVEHTEPRVTVRHTISGVGLGQRGAVIGAWSEVWNPRTNETRGFFVAAIEEYKPKDASPYSPWLHQVSAMILAAAERQSTAMGTPLSGLIGEGEAEINAGPDRPVLGGDAAPESRQLEQGAPLPEAVEDVIARAFRLNHRGLQDRAAWEMRTLGQTDSWVAGQVQAAHAELDRIVELERADALAAAGAEPQPVAACGEPDPVREGVRCEREEGHDGPHRGDGQTWDAFVPEPEPEPDDSPEAGDVSQERLV